MKNKTKRKLAALSLVGLMAVGASAWLTNKEVATGVNYIQPGTIDVVFENEASAIALTANEAIPMTNDYALTFLTPYEFSIANNGAVPFEYTIYAAIDEGDNDFDTSLVKVALISEEEVTKTVTLLSDATTAKAVEYTGGDGYNHVAIADADYADNNPVVTKITDITLTEWDGNSDYDTVNNIVDFDNYTGTIYSYDYEYETTEKAYVVEPMSLATAVSGIKTVAELAVNDSDSYSLIAYLDEDMVLDEYTGNSIAFHLTVSATQVGEEDEPEVSNDFTDTDGDFYTNATSAALTYMKGENNYRTSLEYYVAADKLAAFEGVTGAKVYRIIDSVETEVTGVSLSINAAGPTAKSYVIVFPTDYLKDNPGAAFRTEFVKD